MTIESDLFSALKTLVANRVYPESFIQPNGALPIWPAIRYDFISEVPAIMLCGDTGEDAPDTRIQIDVVAKGFMEARALRLQVLAVMQTFIPPAIYQDTFSRKDEETKTHNLSMDYIIYKSSAAGSP